MKKASSRLIFISLVFIAIEGMLLADSGRMMADPWPVLDSYRELELRGYISLQPNVWPLRSGRMLDALPEKPADIASKLWIEELKHCLSVALIKNDTIGIIFEPGIDGILNNPRDPDDRFYPKMRLGGGMAKDPVEGFVSYEVNLRWAREENFRGRQWSGFAGRPDQVYLRVDGDDWGVQFGRDYLVWGEGLILGNAHAPFDRIDYQIDIGRFRFSGFSGWLDPIYCRRDFGDTLIWELSQRYLSGHRMEYLSKHFSIALHEIILYGGFGRSFEGIYTVPLYWFHAQQLNLGLDDNTFVGGDVQLLFPPVRLSCEFLVDDIQVEAKTQGDEEPPEIAIAAQADYGLTVFDKWLTLSARYEGVTNWTYNQIRYWNKYIYLNDPLGSYLGNDADIGSFKLKFMANPKLIIDIEAFYLRKGEGRIEAIWSEPWMDIEGEYTEPFPSGIVEKTSGLKLCYEGNFRPFLFCNVGFEYGWVQNYLHEPEKKSDYWKFEFGLSGSLYKDIKIK
ncbi:hypothetical protein KAH81_06325 [bacterium]|nr:hypothetical protein [bacterium]